MPSDSRDRMIQSALELFRERGYSGTGFREINAHSGVARGAIYHHFPGGKAELAEEVMRFTGETVGQALEGVAREGDAVSALAAFVAGWRYHLTETEFRAGCPIVAIVSESHHDAPRLAEVASAAFASWTRPLAAALRRAGVPQARARRLATLAVSAVEGAVTLCRAERSTRPLDEVGRELEASFADAISAAS